MTAKLESTLLRIDAQLRQTVALIWNSLPPDKRSGGELQSQALRLLMRVIENFSDDLTVFESAPVQTGIRERHPNTGKPWSAQADDELRKLFESGNSIADLALYFQRTANGVRARLVKLGLLDPSEFQSRFAAA